MQVTQQAEHAAKHSLISIQSAMLKTSPFPYMVVDNVFPERFYAQILAHLPTEQDCINVTQGVWRLDLVDDPGSPSDSEWEIDNFFSEGRFFEFWQAFRNAYFSKNFVQALLERFDKHTNGDEFASGRLAIDKQGAGAGPHRDRRDKMLSLIFYLPKSYQTQNAKDSGTLVLSPKNANMIASDKHYTFEEFDIVDHIDYKPNRLFAFAVTRNENGQNSFHGYQQLSPNDRYTIKYHVHHNIDFNNLKQELAWTKQHAHDWRKINVSN